jgi:hypothetical protein
MPNNCASPLTRAAEARAEDQRFERRRIEQHERVHQVGPAPRNVCAEQAAERMTGEDEGAAFAGALEREHDFVGLARRGARERAGVAPAGAGAVDQDGSCFSAEGAVQVVDRSAARVAAGEPDDRRPAIARLALGEQVDAVAAEVDQAARWRMRLARLRERPEVVQRAQRKQRTDQPDEGHERVAQRLALRRQRFEQRS